MDLIKITDLSARLGISSRTLRYYEESGLIKSIRPQFEAYRFYDKVALERLRQIMVLRKMQIPIKDIVRIYENPEMSTLVDVFVGKIAEIDGEVTALSELKGIINTFYSILLYKGGVKMYWLREIQNAISYIEDNLINKIGVDEIALHIKSSSDSFQKIFGVVTGITVGNYIRCRRLSLAGEELAESNNKVIDIALKYGYETTESFTKAFTRFHGITPSEGRRNRSELRYFFTISMKII